MRHHVYAFNVYGVLQGGGGTGTVTPALVAKAVAGGDTGWTLTINSTGSNFLIAGVSEGQPTVTVSDSNANTWQKLVGPSSGPTVNIWYVQNPTVGSGHVIYGNSGGGFVYSAGAVYAFSNVSTTSALDQQTITGNVGAFSSITAPSLSPSSAPGVVMVCAAIDTSISAPTINQGFNTPVDFVNSTGINGIIASYLINTSTASVNPSFTWSVSSGVALAMATFKHA